MAITPDNARAGRAQSSDVGHGFLVRGTLRPSLGATTGFTRVLRGGPSTRTPVVRPIVTQPNPRIPGSIQQRKGK